MHTINAKAVYIVRGAEDTQPGRERIRRMMAHIDTDRVEQVDDAGLAAAVEEHRLSETPRHGMTDGFAPVVIFNRIRFDEPPQVPEERKERFPALFRSPSLQLAGYAGFDWRPSGSPEWREKTGAVCQPAYQLHTIVGCPFRCAYCGLGRLHNIMVNIEEFVARLDGYIDAVNGQTLYQYDNWTDTVCFEPEYGGSRLLVEYFASKPGKYLELYVGKSDNVGFLLDLDHRGKTVCCWSVAGGTQSGFIERKTATMEARIEAARKCQEAGYHVRFRLSPIVPVKNWERENRELIQRIFAETRPDVITFETLRYLNYDAICQSIDVDLLDDEFVAAMRETEGTKAVSGCEIPDGWRLRVYRFIISQLEEAGPETPYALCREQRSTWELLADDFARHGQTPDNYVCNCGPTSAPGNPLLAWSALRARTDRSVKPTRHGTAG
jgi:hypothetical protein